MQYPAMGSPMAGFVFCVLSLNSIVFQGRPPKGSLVQRELSAVRLTEGLSGGRFLFAFLCPHSFLSLFGERKEPPQRQKKPAPFRFRRGGESSISAGSFFLSKL